MSANNPFGAEMGAGTSSTVYGVVISSVISSRGSLDFENVVGAEDELELDDEELNDDELNEELDDICRLLAIVMDQDDQEPDLQGELQSAQTPSHWGSHLLPHG
eukprot:XP_011420953.1 PREDICTED: uncharacterized protein LOC105323593 [Crassostrea gigas]